MVPPKYTYIHKTYYKTWCFPSSGTEMMLPLSLALSPDLDDYGNMGQAGLFCSNHFLLFELKWSRNQCYYEFN